MPASVLAGSGVHVGPIWAWEIRLQCGIQLARNESGDITMNRARGMLNGQILTAVEIEPGNGTAFSFELGCSFRTCPAPPGSLKLPAAGPELSPGKPTADCEGNHRSTCNAEET